MHRFEKQQRLDQSSIFKKILTVLDFFGQPPQFRILKRQKFTTILGLCLTILLMIVCSLYLYFQFSELLNQTNPHIIISETLPQNTPAFSLLSNNFTFAFSVSNSSLFALSTYQKNYNVSIQACNRSRHFNETSKSTQVSLKCRNIPIESCDMDKHFPQTYQKNYFAKFRLHNLFCLEKQTTDQDSPGFMNSDVFQYLQIQIMPCKNSTHFNQCNSEEEIKEALFSSYYTVFMGDNLIKLGNQGRPYEEIINLQYISFSSSVSKQFYSSFRIIDTRTDVGLIQKEFLSDSCLIQSTTRDFQAPYNSQYFVQNLIFIEQRASNYQRTYLKIQNILGSVGGLWQIVTLLISIIVSPTISTLMNIQIANRMFNFESCADKSLLTNSSKEVRCVRNLDDKLQIQNIIQQEQLLDNDIHQSVMNEKKELIQQFLKRKKKSLRVGLCDLFFMQLGYKKYQKQQINYAIEKTLGKLDVVNLLTKLQEIDKLKYILLTEEQLNLFNYLPKPLIPQEMFAEDFKSKLAILEDRAEFQFLLHEEKSEFQKVEQALQAFIKLHQKSKLSKIDKNIFKLLGDDLKSIFRQVNQTKNDIVEQKTNQFNKKQNFYQGQQYPLVSPRNNLESAIVSKTEINQIFENEQSEHIKEIKFLKDSAQTRQRTFQNQE